MASSVSRLLGASAVPGAGGHDLNRRVAHLAKKAVDDRAMEQQVPARTRELAEDDVRDALALCELDKGVGDARAGQPDDSRAELFRKKNVVRQRHVILRLDAAGAFLRGFDIHRVPI